MLVIRPENTFDPAELIDQSMSFTLRRYGEARARLISEPAEMSSGVRFSIAASEGLSTQVEVAAIPQKGELPATIALVAPNKRDVHTRFQIELGGHLATLYKAKLWKPEFPDQPAVPVATAPRVVRHEAEGMRVVTAWGRFPVRDLSSSGMSFSCRKALRNGQLLPVTLQLTALRNLKALLLIRWRGESDGSITVGGEFVAMPEPVQKQLLSFVFQLKRQAEESARQSSKRRRAAKPKQAPMSDGAMEAGAAQADAGESETAPVIEPAATEIE